MIPVHPLEFVLLSSLCLLGPHSIDQAAERCGEPANTAPHRSALRSLARLGWAEVDEDGVYRVTDGGRSHFDNRATQIQVYQPFTAEGIGRELHPLRPLLRSAALKLTGSAADADDLVSETIARAMQMHERFVPGTALSAWTLYMQRNLFVNEYRASKRRPHGNTVSKTAAEMDGAAMRWPVAGAADPVDRNGGEYVGELEDIAAAITALPELYARPLRLRIVGYTYEDIATRLGVALGTAKSRILHARRALARALYEQGYDDHTTISHFAQPRRGKSSLA